LQRFLGSLHAWVGKPFGPLLFRLTRLRALTPLAAGSFNRWICIRSRLLWPAFRTIERHRDHFPLWWPSRYPHTPDRRHDCAPFQFRG
jgi:hypothetical protein